VEEERAIARPPPRDDVEIKALARADRLTDREKAVVQDVVDFLYWCHGDLETEKSCPSENVAMAHLVQTN